MFIVLLYIFVIFPISQTQGDQKNPDVIFDGQNFFVVWQDERNGDRDIYGARVTRNGTVLDPDGIPISVKANSQKNPSCVMGQNIYIVSWIDGREDEHYTSLYYTTLSLNGQVIDTNGVLLKKGYYIPPPYEEFLRILNTEITCGDSLALVSYLFEWANSFEGGFACGGKYIFSNGDTSALSELSLPNSFCFAPSASYSSQKFYYSYYDYTQGETDLALYDELNNPTNYESVITIASTLPSSTGHYQKIWYGNGELLIISQNDSLFPNYLWGALIDTSLNVIDSFFVVENSLQDIGKPELIFVNNKYYLFFHDYSSGNGDIYAKRVLPDGNLIDTNAILITGGISDQIQPAIAFDGEKFLLVWADSRNGDFDIYGTFVDTLLNLDVKESFGYKINEKYKYTNEGIFDIQGRKIKEVKKGIYFLRKNDKTYKLIRIR